MTVVYDSAIYNYDNVNNDYIFQKISLKFKKIPKNILNFLKN